MTRFYVSEIHNRVAQPISEEEFQDGWVDGRGDVGVDFIHRDDGTVLIIKGKHRGCKGTVELEEILHFKTVFGRLLSPSFKKNRKLSEILGDIDFERDRFVLKFVTLGKMVGQADVETKTPQFPVHALGSRESLRRG